MRQFKLTNSIGEVYNLNDLDFFLYDPDNLGYKRKASYKRVGSLFVKYKDEIDQPTPNGVLRFKNPNAYEKYYDFSRFAMKSPLRLEYTPSEETYYLDCYVKELEKSEIEGGGLHCKISFEAMSYYYRLYAMEAGTEPTEGKIYDYTYPFIYSDTGAGTVALDVDSSIESPIKISIYGEVVNPTWAHYVNNVLIESGCCMTTIRAGRRLVIDTTQTPFSITEQDALGNVISNKYADSDMETERFFFLQAGRNRISVAHDGANIPKLKVEAKVLYETV